LPGGRLKHDRRVLDVSMELEADRRRMPLFLFLSQVLKIVFLSHRELFVIDPRSHKFTRTNLSDSSFLTHLSDSSFLTHLCRRLIVRYLKYDQKKRKSTRSISGEHEARGLHWFGSSGE
jgi:hypothetical protein